MRIRYLIATAITIAAFGCDSPETFSGSSDPLETASVPVEVPVECTDLVRSALQEFPDCAILFAQDSHGTCVPRAETREEFSARPTAPLAYCAILDYERIRDSER